MAMPRGRMTIRKGGRLLGPALDGRPTSRPIHLWEFEHAEDSLIGKLGVSYDTALSSVDRIEQQSAEIARNVDLTDSGRAKAKQQFVRDELLPSLVRASRQSGKAKTALGRLKSQFAIPEVVPSAVHIAIASKFASMTQAERDSYVAANVDSLEPQVEETLRALPAFLTGGIAASLRGQLDARALERAHPGGERADHRTRERD